MIEILHTNQPVPSISGNITTYITEKLKEENYEFILEYGSGNSTRFFITKLLEFGKKCTFISVEYEKQWFIELSRIIRSDFKSIKVSNEKFELKQWDYEKCKRFFYMKNATSLDVPNDLKRFPKAKRLFGGLFNSKMFLYKLRIKNRPVDGHYKVTLNDSINLWLILRSEFMKDQYGESPIKNEYIGAALVPLKHIIPSQKELAAAFIIDGGPRSDILDAIFELEDGNGNFFPTVFLCDANRSIYSKSIRRRPSGRFLKGSNRTLNNEPLYNNQYSNRKTKFFHNKNKVSLSELLDKEVWFYQGAQK
ncbi:MAG: hypothetical protein JSV31_19920 [Desulfobacterales bacterium]|nr:MAG: hypothetical protein JSV31_19920 [Desulfobacterales bacterium]